MMYVDARGRAFNMWREESIGLEWLKLASIGQADALLTTYYVNKTS